MVQFQSSRQLDKDTGSQGARGPGVVRGPASLQKEKAPQPRPTGRPRGCQELHASPLDTQRTSGLELNTEPQHGASEHTEVSRQPGFQASEREQALARFVQLCPLLTQTLTESRYCIMPGSKSQQSELPVHPIPMVSLFSPSCGFCGGVFFPASSNIST